MLTTSPIYQDSLVGSGNPLDSSKDVYTPLTPDELDQKDMQYQSYLEIRLSRAQEARDRVWPEFTDKTYLTYFEQNEKIANTYLEPKKNEDDVKIASGTIESKLNTLLSHIDNLNLTPEVRAFDREDVPMRDLGTAMTDIMDKLAEHDGGVDGGDSEKRMLRQRELLKQGTVFVQDSWCKKYQTKKKLAKAFNGKFRQDADFYATRLVKVFEGPDRRLLYAPNVYLGDPTVFSMDDQPYAFTIEQMHYDVAKGMFGELEMWKHVQKGMNGNTLFSLTNNTVGGRTIYDGKFRMMTLKDDQVEIIKYQDPTRDEFQIMINGVMMLPIGFPLSAVTPGGKVNIAKQILYPINPQFAYGKSFVSSGDVYELSKILDEMLKLFVLKTRKSVTPPYINLSGKIISRRVLSPGNISQGIPAGALQPIGTESQGVTTGEFQVYQEILNRIENSTVSPIFSGQFGKANTTATEVLEVQRQARLALGIITAACTMLEVKLSYLRLPIVITHYLAPNGQFVDDDGIVREKYRSVSREVDIEGDGRGTRRVIPMDGPLPSQKIVRQLELLDENNTGYPSQRIYLSPRGLNKALVTWRVVVVPKEKDSSAYEKLLFRETLADAMTLINLGSMPNVAGIENEFSKIYGMDRSKFFGSADESMNNSIDMRSQALASGKPASPGTSTPAPGMTSQVGAGK